MCNMKRLCIPRDLIWSNSAVMCIVERERVGMHLQYFLYMLYLNKQRLLKT